MSSKFSPEFKKQLVGEVVKGNRKIAHVAREYGVGPETLRNWVKKHRAENPSGDLELSDSERTELDRLRKENRELRMQEQFLKKAAAFFAKEYQ